MGNNFHRLFAASAISNLGDGIFFIALPLVAADLTRSPTTVAGVTIAMRIPWLLFALVAGALVDRWDRRRVMWTTDLFRTLLVGGLAAAVMTDNHSIALIYAVGFALGVAETMFDNASQTILPSLVAEQQLQVANGRLMAAETVSNSFVGPPLGGFLVAAAVSVPFWIDSASYLAAALLMASIGGSFRASRTTDTAANESSPSRPTIRTEIAEGVRWLWRHDLLRTLALLLGLMNLGFMAGFSVLVLFAQDMLGLDEIGFGLLATAMAAGSVIGGLTAGRLTEMLGKGRILLIGSFGTAIGQLAIAPMSNSWAAAAALAMAGFVATIWNVVTVSLRQSVIPDQLLGRVNSVYRFLGWGGMPVGALAGGLLASRFGLRSPFWVGGVTLLLAAAITAPKLRRADEILGLRDDSPLG